MKSYISTIFLLGMLLSEHCDYLSDFGQKKNRNIFFEHFSILFYLLKKAICNHRFRLYCVWRLVPEWKMSTKRRFIRVWLRDHNRCDCIVGLRFFSGYRCQIWQLQQRANKKKSSLRWHGIFGIMDLYLVHLLLLFGRCMAQDKRRS